METIPPLTEEVTAVIGNYTNRKRELQARKNQVYRLTVGLGGVTVRQEENQTAIYDQLELREIKWAAVMSVREKFCVVGIHLMQRQQTDVSFRVSDVPGANRIIQAVKDAKTGKKKEQAYQLMAKDMQKAVEVVYLREPQVQEVYDKLSLKMDRHRLKEFLFMNHKICKAFLVISRAKATQIEKYFHLRKLAIETQPEQQQVAQMHGYDIQVRLRGKNRSDDEKACHYAPSEQERLENTVMAHLKMPHQACITDTFVDIEPEHPPLRSKTTVKRDIVRLRGVALKPRKKKQFSVLVSARPSPVEDPHQAHEVNRAGDITLSQMQRLKCLVKLSYCYLNSRQPIEDISVIESELYHLMNTLQLPNYLSEVLNQALKNILKAKRDESMRSR